MVQHNTGIGSMGNNDLLISQLSRFIGIVLVLWGFISIFSTIVTMEYKRYFIVEKYTGSESIEMYNPSYIILNLIEPGAMILTGIILFAFCGFFQKLLDE